MAVTTLIALCMEMQIYLLDHISYFPENAKALKIVLRTKGMWLKFMCIKEKIFPQALYKNRNYSKCDKKIVFKFFFVLSF